MDNKHEILELLRGVAAGRTTPEQSLLELKTAPIRDLGYAKVDLDRSPRPGAAASRYSRPPRQNCPDGAPEGRRCLSSIIVHLRKLPCLSTDHDRAAGVPDAQLISV